MNEDRPDRSARVRRIADVTSSNSNQEGRKISKTDKCSISLGDRSPSPNAAPRSNVVFCRGSDQGAVSRPSVVSPAPSGERIEAAAIFVTPKPCRFVSQICHIVRESGFDWRILRDRAGWM